MAICPCSKTWKKQKVFIIVAGPYTVLDKTSPVNYRIQLIGGTVSITVLRNRLKQCHGDPNRVILMTSKSRFPTSSNLPSHNRPFYSHKSYRDALVDTPLRSAGYTSSESPTISNSVPASSRPVRNRQPPDRYGIYISH